MCLALLPTGLTAQDSTSLSGDFYVVIQNGEVRQGAANRVFLIPADRTEAIEAHWLEACSAQRDRVNAVRAKDEQRLAEIRDRVAETTDPDQMASLLAEMRDAASQSLEVMFGIAEEEERARFDWLRGQAVAESATGREARFNFGPVDPADYLLYAHLPLADRHYFWLVEATLVAGTPSSIDLDNQNVLREGAFDCVNIFAGERIIR